MNAGGHGELFLGEIGRSAQPAEAVRAVFRHGAQLSGTVPDLSRATPDFPRACSGAVREGLDDPKLLPTKLRAERERQDLTVEWIAQRIGASKQVVSAFENGQEPPGEEKIARWILALGLPGAWADDWADWRAAEKAVRAMEPVRARSSAGVPERVRLTAADRETLQLMIYRHLRGMRP